MISNAETYFSIAQEALDEMNRLTEQSRRTKPDGSLGYIVTLDPNRGSFKQALIAIAFSAMYFEAVIYIAARQKLSKTQAVEIDGRKYEERLPEIGINDQPLIDGAKALREARKDLVHEKAITQAEMKSATVRFAQKSASEAVTFISTLRGRLNGAPSQETHPN